jgi:hypothetical protein
MFAGGVPSIRLSVAFDSFKIRPSHPPGNGVSTALNPGWNHALQNVDPARPCLVKCAGLCGGKQLTVGVRFSTLVGETAIASEPVGGLLKWYPLVVPCLPTTKCDMPVMPAKAPGVTLMKTLLFFSPSRSRLRLPIDVLAS